MVVKVLKKIVKIFSVLKNIPKKNTILEPQIKGLGLVFELQILNMLRNPMFVVLKDSQKLF